jgi:SpoVK/Ycf46/Vps4 family AAA+-type ATPase
MGEDDYDDENDAEEGCNGCDSPEAEYPDPRYMDLKVYCEDCYYNALDELATELEDEAEGRRVEMRAIDKKREERVKGKKPKGKKKK